ncbi:MAG: choice-of-anchor I family protein [Thermodesulfobacteriota bacterium]
MNRTIRRYTILSLTLLGVGLGAQPASAKPPVHPGPQTLDLQVLGAYRTSIFAEGGSEIPAHDPKSQRLFVTNGAEGKIDIIDMADPANPVLVKQVDLAGFGKAATSVAVHRGLVAAAVVNTDRQQNGQVVFMDTDGNVINHLTVGALPDMLTFTPNGRYLLVANEGEPSDDYTVDPEGSVSIIDLEGDEKHLCPGGYLRRAGRLEQEDVRTAGFAAFNDQELPSGIRVFGPNASVAQDMEPEYITIDDQSRTAWVTLQENNAVAVIDIKDAKVEKLLSLGFKDHSLPGNELDPSNEDGGINIANWPVKGMYLPDAVASYMVRGKTYIVTANEGDSRDYAGFSEEARIKDLVLDPVAFPDAATLQKKVNLGRLKATTTLGDTDGDGDFDELYSFGARSFSIRTAGGELVYDSGSDLERITADVLPFDFNSDNEENDSFDGRSDDKGPEPEGLAIGRIGNRTYCFLGLERIGGVMVYDITNPRAPEFVRYLNNRDFAGDPALDTAGDLGPEGLLFIDAGKSPIKKPLLVVANEVSGSTTIYEIEPAIKHSGGK